SETVATIIHQSGLGTLFMKDSMRVMIIGFGPHAKRIYYPAIKNLSKDFNLHVASIVDLESKKADIENFLSKQAT
ncbi:MAG: hypothetical protein AAB709_01410, partial [Patescibacteria group bacterium]